jgi:hypothetical protein
MTLDEPNRSGYAAPPHANADFGATQSLASRKH